MLTKNDYPNDAHRPLIKKYREMGEGCTGSAEGLAQYLEGLAHGAAAEEYDGKNYRYSYPNGTHCKAYEKKGYAYFQKSMDCFEKAAREGNDLAMMNYALYLFSYRAEYEAAMEWFLAASEAGLAVADYQLSRLYAEGKGGVESNAERATFYREQFLRRCGESERQLMLAWDLLDETHLLGRGWLFAWYCGFPFPLLYDTPAASPSEWKYGVPKKQKRFFATIFDKALAIRRRT